MQRAKHIVIVGGGTSGCVLAARLSENPAFEVTLLEVGPDDATYDSAVLEPIRAPESWLGAPHAAFTAMGFGDGMIPTVQGRLLGGTSAVNGMATLRGLPEDYDGWANMGLAGWGWSDVLPTFSAAETDQDFPDSILHGNAGPLPVRRWRRDEMGQAQVAFLDGMGEVGENVVTDINDAASCRVLAFSPSPSTPVTSASVPASPT